MLEVIYKPNDSDKVTQYYFESSDKYLEWKENNLDIEILEILEEDLL